MEQFPRGDQDNIPNSEKGILIDPLVTQEEMAAELERMKEAIAPEKQAEAPAEIPAVEEAPEIPAEKRSPEISEREKADKARIEELLAELDKKAEAAPEAGPEEEREPERPEAPPQEQGGGDDEHGYSRTYEGHAIIDRETCPICHGKGRRFIIFTCSRCGGLGMVGINKGMEWSTKKIKRKKPQDVPGVSSEAPGGGAGS